MTQKEFLRLCVNGTSEEIEAALESGASVNKKSYIYGAKVPPLFVAVMEENSEAVRVLMKHGARAGDGLTGAVIKGKKKLLKLLLDCGADINQIDSNGHNPLMLAVIANNARAVKWLIEFGADVNYKTKAGYNALTYTVLMQLENSGKKRRKSFDPNIIAYLMRGGAEYGEAMIIAVKSGNIPFLRMILENGADINRQFWFEGEQTPLAAAMFMGEKGISYEMVKFLAENGADVNEVFEFEGGTVTSALNVAVTSDRPDIADILLTYGADPDYQDATGRTALVYAVMTGTEILKTLLSHGADPDLPDREGRTPLMLAALIEAGADVNVQDNEGMTALLWTVASRDRTPGFLLSALIRTGGFRAEGGDSWFMLAAVYVALKRDAQLEAVRMLIQYGADVKLTDNKGMNAVMCAMMSMDDEIAEILSEAAKNDDSEA